MFNFAKIIKFLLLGGVLHPRYIQRVLIFYVINNYLSCPRLFGLKRNLLNSIKGINLAKGVKIVGPIKITIPKLIIGEDTWVGKNFYCNGNGIVKIGMNCDIAPEVIFNTGGHKIGKSERRGGEGVIFNQTVKDGCWIGARATFVNNCIIGDSSVIAAGSLVIKDVPANSLVAGVPAKVIRDL